MIKSCMAGRPDAIFCDGHGFDPMTPLPDQILSIQLIEDPKIIPFPGMSKSEANRPPSLNLDRYSSNIVNSFIACLGVVSVIFFSSC
jgi:hypothetical protein